MSLTLWRRPTPRHRAVDRVRQLTAERDYLLAALVKQDSKLAAANGQTEQLLAQIDNLTIENEALRTDYVQLFARYHEVTAISVPAPADRDEFEDTVPISRVIPLFDAFTPTTDVA